MALLIANEWENQKEIMKVSGLPMVSLPFPVVPLPPQDRAVCVLVLHLESLLRQHYIIPRIGHPQTSLASRALDGMSDPTVKAGVIDELLRYLDTDTTW